MTTVLLIRHGMTDAVGRRLVSWLPGVGLNDEGARQVRALAGELEGLRLDAIHTSPLERAVATAEAIVRRQSCAIVQRSGLGEARFGEWTGRTLDELDGDERWRRWNSIRTIGRAPAGESMLDIQRRMFDEVSYVCERHADGVVAMVSHADPIRSLLVYLLGMSMDIFTRLRIDPASVSVVRISDSQVEVAGVNLRAGAIRDALC